MKQIGTEGNYRIYFVGFRSSGEEVLGEGEEVAATVDEVLLLGHVEHFHGADEVGDELLVRVVDSLRVEVVLEEIRDDPVNVVSEKGLISKGY